MKPDDQDLTAEDRAAMNQIQEEALKVQLDKTRKAIEELTRNQNLSNLADNLFDLTNELKHAKDLMGRSEQARYVAIAITQLDMAYAVLIAHAIPHGASK